MNISDVFSIFGMGRTGDRENLIRLMRALNRTRFPQLKYFLDLSVEEQAATLARIPLLSRKHDDWFMFRDVERKDTSFFGPMQTVDDHGARQRLHVEQRIFGVHGPARFLRAGRRQARLEHRRQWRQ
jgi:hypothetical protein